MSVFKIKASHLSVNLVKVLMVLTLTVLAHELKAQSPDFVITPILPLLLFNDEQVIELPEISAGNAHSCASFTGGLVKCWGDNSSGQLGDGTTVQRLTPVQVTGITTSTAIAAGYSHNCALLTSGSIKCWGSNVNGELGDGTTVNRTIPVLVTGISTAISVSVGDFHGCALLLGGSVKCWGDNTKGQIGDNTAISRVTPVSVTGISTATMIALGGRHSCALKSNGSISCWGNNISGQLGNFPIYSQIPFPVPVVEITTASAIAAGAFHNCARLNEGSIKCWGNNFSGQVGDGTTDTGALPRSVAGISTASSIALGGFHSCAKLDDGMVKCWGANNYGQLGNAIVSEQATSTPVSVTGLGATTAIAGGDFHSCARLNNSSIMCWGKNETGQLGNNSTTDSSIPVLVQ